MSYVERHAIAIATDASGNCTAYSPVVQGLLHQISYVPDGTNPLATGADLTLTEEDSALPLVTKLNIGTAAFSMAPRQPTHAVADGAALLYAAAGAAVAVPIAVKGRLKFVIAQGGNTLSGTFYAWIG